MIYFMNYEVLMNEMLVCLVKKFNSKNIQNDHLHLMGVNKNQKSKLKHK